MMENLVNKVLEELEKSENKKEYLATFLKNYRTGIEKDLLVDILETDDLHKALESIRYSKDTHIVVDGNTYKLVPAESEEDNYCLKCGLANKYCGPYGILCANLRGKNNKNNHNIFKKI